MISGSHDRLDDELWVIWCPERGMWWGPFERGYVAMEDLEEAGLYAVRRAFAIWRDSMFQDTPMPRLAALELLRARQELAE